MKVKRASFDDEMKIAAKGLAKVEEVTGVTRAASGAPQLEAESTSEVLKVAIRECCPGKDSFFSELEDLRDLETGSAPHQNLTLVLAEPRCSTRSALGQAIFAHVVFFKEDMADVVKVMSSLTLSGAQGHNFCYHLMFFH